MSFAFTPASFLGREVAEVVVSRAIFRTTDFFESLSVQSEFAPRRPLKKEVTYIGIINDIILIN